jgi:flagellar hook protein FlgE
MSLFGSIYTSLSGLSVSARGLDNLSKNIANINTPGFKATDLYYRSNANEGADVSGSALRFTSGDVRSTGVQTDMAIDGSGLFILRDGDKQYFTRAGQFQFDQDGYLVDPISGYRVATLNESGNLVDFNINDFNNADFNESTLLKMVGALNKSAVEGDIFPPKGASAIEVDVIDENGASHKIDLRFTKRTGDSWDVDFLSKNGSKVQPSHRLDFNSLGSLVSDTTIGALNFRDFEFISKEEFGTSFVGLPRTSSLNQFSLGLSNGAKLVSSINGNLSFFESGNFSVNEKGLLVHTETGGVLAGRDANGNLIEFDLSSVDNMPGKATANVTMNGTLNKNYDVLSSSPPAIVDKVIYPPLSQPGMKIPVRDSNGVVFDVTVRFTKQTTNGDLWSLTVTDENDPSKLVTGTTTRNLGFDSLGNLLNSSVGVTIDRPDGKKMTFNLDFSGGDNNPGLVLGTTQNSINVLGDDGYGTGTLADISFDATGQSVLYFTNGQTLNSHKLAAVTPDDRNVTGVAIDFSQLSSVSNSSDAKITVAENDGNLSGRLVSMSFTGEGTIKIEYSNGEKKDVGTVALAKFDNPELLTSLNGSLFENSGDLYYSVEKPNDASMGSLVSQSLEMSNVDLSQEFSQIIIIQRGYQASSQVLNVANEMIEDLYNSVGR